MKKTISFIVIAMLLLATSTTVSAKSFNSKMKVTTVSNNTIDSQTITPEQAEQLVAKNFNTSLQFKYQCIGKLHTGFKIDGKPSEEYYCVYVLQDGEVLQGAFYVDSLTGIVYENYSDGCIYRLPDKTFVGMYGDK